MRLPRVAVVGAGYWGHAHVRTFASLAGCELTWVCDRSAGALARAQQVSPHCRLTESFTDILEAPDVDAIVLATPAATHGEMTCRALASGRHVLVEKPLALSVHDAEEVERAARASGAALVVGHLMLYHPAVRYLHGLIRSGELGDLYYLTSTRVNLGRIRTDENALWSLAPHDLSMLDYLLELPLLSIDAAGHSFLQPEIHDVVFVTASFQRPSGPPVIAHVQASWLSPRKERRLVVVGASKMVEFDDVGHDKLHVHDRGYDRPPDFSSFAEYLTLRDGPVSIPHVPMVEPLVSMAGHFVDCIERRATPLSDAASGVRVVRMLSAAQDSLRRSRA
jgi:predicted dehydrogenase